MGKQLDDMYAVDSKWFALNIVLGLVTIVVAPILVNIIWNITNYIQVSERKVSLRSIEIYIQCYCKLSYIYINHRFVLLGILERLKEN